MLSHYGREARTASIAHWRGFDRLPPAPLLPLAFDDEKVRFIVVGDVHWLTVGDFRDTALRAAIADLNTWKPNALIQIGDLGHNFPERVESAHAILKTGCKRPMKFVVGNHDIYEYAPGTNSAPAVSSFLQRPTPMTDSFTMVSGDNSLFIRCIILDCNYYRYHPSRIHPVYVTGDYLGSNDALDPGSGYYRQIGTTQLNWMADELAKDTTSQAVIVFSHYPLAQIGIVPLDGKLVADILQVDGRPAALFSGHIHPDATTYTLPSTDGIATYTVYKMPALQESGAWLRVELHVTEGAIVIDQLLVKNFTQPGTWTINAPFTV